MADREIDGDLGRENLDDDLYSAIEKESMFYSATEVAEDGEGGLVMEYRDPEVIKDHIEEVISTFGTDLVFNGIEELIAATEPEDEDSKPLLRRGQIIFGTVSLSHHSDSEDTIQGNFHSRFASGHLIPKFLWRISCRASFQN